MNKFVKFCMVAAMMVSVALVACSKKEEIHVVIQDPTQSYDKEAFDALEYAKDHIENAKTAEEVQAAMEEAQQTINDIEAALAEEEKAELENNAEAQEAAIALQEAAAKKLNELNY